MALKADAISKRSSTGWLLKNVSFEAAPAEVLGIVSEGDSGSILLRIIAGLEKNDGGTILFDSSDVIRRGQLERKIAILSARDDDGMLKPFRRLLGSKRSDKTNIDQRMREILARGDKVVLMDEGALPGCHSIEEIKHLAAIAREAGACLLYATPRFHNVLAFCDRAILLDKGEIIQEGTPAEIYLAPASAAAGSMTGRINIFEARRLSSSKADVPEFQTIVGEHRLNTGITEKARLGALNRNVRLAIRPEHVSISFGASFPEDNLLRAVVAGVTFLGPMTLVNLDAGGLKVESLVMRLVGLKPGDECMIGMPPDRMMIFAE